MPSEVLANAPTFPARAGFLCKRFGSNHFALVLCGFGFGFGFFAGRADKRLCLIGRNMVEEAEHSHGGLTGNLPSSKSLQNLQRPLNAAHHAQQGAFLLGLCRNLWGWLFRSSALGLNLWRFCLWLFRLGLLGRLVLWLGLGIHSGWLIAPFGRLVSVDCPCFIRRNDVSCDQFRCLFQNLRLVLYRRIIVSQNQIPSIIKQRHQVGVERRLVVADSGNNCLMNPLLQDRCLNIVLATCH